MNMLPLWLPLYLLTPLQPVRHRTFARDRWICVVLPFFRTFEFSENVQFFYCDFHCVGCKPSSRGLCLQTAIYSTILFYSLSDDRQT